MTSKSEKDRAKQIQDKCQTVLNEMLRDEDNKYCVDCDTKGPRWASWNIGIFLCIRCAGIHRNLGVHISKVKSVNLDTWTPEQVVSLQQMGNSKARAVYEANLPDNFRRPQSDSALESFVRAKYEQKKYIAREWVPQPVPKVNWEKEIDEEIERQKRKKKQSHITTDKNKPILKTENVTIPQLPKPKAISSSGSGSKSSSPKLNRNEASPNTKNIDLLGLDNQANGAQQQTDDAFSNFLSAPQKTEEEPAKAQSEEESFFNQAAPTEKEKTKLTKDSILALYANTPPQAPMYQLPMGPFQQSQPFVQAPVSFPTGTIPGVGYQAGQVPVQATFPPAQGVFHSMQTSQFPAQNFANATAFPAQNQQALFAAQNQQFNQFQSNSNVSQFQNTPFVNNQFASFPQQAVVNNQQFQGQFAGNFVVPGQNGSAPNPFYSQPQPVAAPAAVNIQQQFNNMSIGNAPPKSTILPAATANLWQ